jgi:hypothetical protein
LTRRANQRHHSIIAQFVKPPMALPEPIEIAVTARRMGGALRETHLSKRQLMGIAYAPPILRAGCSVDGVTWPRPASRPAMEMSSSMASQCRPMRLNSTWLRSSGVARKSRGNHASGTPSVRPSVSSTHIVCSSKRTLVGEMVIRSIVARMERSAIRDRERRITLR